MVYQPEWPTRTLRLASRVSVGEGCWPWTGFINHGGYGLFSEKVNRRKRMLRAHRAVYELMVGPIPEGLTLDHLCRNRRCVRPSHLEPVTRAENVLRGEGLGAANARKTRCHKGHELTEANTGIRTKTGWRSCLTCRREQRQAVAS